MAHHKGGGSTSNGRDSESKRLGMKRADGQLVKAGNILMRQRGTKFHPGNNVGIGSDDTLYALITGILKVERLGRNRRKISVYAVEEKTEVKKAKKENKEETKKVEKKVEKAKSTKTTVKKTTTKKTAEKKTVTK